MSNRTWITVTSVIVSVALVSEISYYIWQLFCKKNSKQKNVRARREVLENQLISIFKKSGIEVDRLKGNDSYFQTVFFFPDKGISCQEVNKSQKCTLKNCRYLHGDQTSLDILCQIIALAQKRMDLCLYIVTNNNLAQVITEAHKRGVIVRIIIDKDQSDTSGTKRGHFMSLGIPVRRNIENLMHHKFVIIDNELLVNGSFNWTSAAVLKNNENIVVSTDQNLVQPFKREFEKLWKDFDPKPCTDLSKPK